MSKLEELIARLCPDGVEYKTTNDLKITSFWLMPATPKFIDKGVEYITSKNIKSSRIDFNDTKYISFEDYQKISKNREIQQGDLLVTMIGTIGEAAFVNEDRLFYGQNLYLIRLDERKIDRKYYYYYLTMPRIKDGLVSKKNTSSQGYIKAGSLDNLKLPVPPLEVQREIVHILDSFTLLTAELAAELAAQQKRFDFFRNKLLSGKSDWKKVTLLEMLKQPVTDGPHVTPKFVDSGIPFVSVESVWDGRIHLEKKRGFISVDSDKEYSKKYKPQKHDVIIVKSGSTTGKVAYVDFEDSFNVWSPLAAMRVNENYLSRYLYHLLQSDIIQNQVKSKASNGSQPNLGMRVLEKFIVPVPTLSEQQRIVDILDRFDALCNDITSGLPAEIGARRKQYEYYRDKLLTFKELKKEA